MKPKEALKEIRELTEAMVGLSLSNEQNLPTTSGDEKRLFEITVSNAASMSVALRNIGYRDIYQELIRARCFNLKMLDGALISMRYRFKKRQVSEHSLSYFPSPDLEQFQNDPELYMEDDIYADVIAKHIVPFPIRFDFSDDETKFVDSHHPYSHLTLGQYTNCRIPVSAPVTPLAFGGFILRSFYNTAYRKFSESIPSSELCFDETITAKEKKIPHLVCRMKN